MMPPVFLNGRFLSQNVSGVQRFSVEIARAIDGLMAVGDWPDTSILMPRFPPSGLQSAPQTSFHSLQIRQVGRSRGHLWEQTELPAAARGGVLVSLGNTAPILAGQQQVVVIHDAGVFDTPESYSLRFRAWYKALQFGISRMGAEIATVSNFSKARIAARLNIDPDRVTVVHEGANHILRAAKDPRTLERHHLQAGRYALVVGNRVAHKNLAALHDAAAALQRRGMLIATTGATGIGAFRGLAEDGIPGRRLGRVNDAELRALYENAVCLLFPSRYEGFGLPPVEAMACGCPVIAARGGAVEEICKDGALYFASGDGSITEALERLLDDGDLAEALRNRGQARAAELSWDVSARALGAVVRRVG
jgi:glycosyltransferase involved in cell wall biosynthesis